MSAAYYRLYKNLIINKVNSEELITEKVDDAHNKGRLTDTEYNDLIELINQIYYN